MSVQTKNQIKKFFKQLFSILNCHVVGLRVNLFSFKNGFKYAVPPNYATTPQAVKLRKKRPFMASFSKK
ncbi:hypothetical protein APD39_17025 [Acinetobacter pittii]|nr:hypothetical protein AYJ52_14815 [Acinetobacter pittii]EXR44182.1 hypothetical protein J655_0103 [Acinetobacter sp. 1294243]KQE09284.1 hypothetical protein APD35_18375 [Acinetobacter pittii]KQE24221.1 hypothetical protein APD39_17025 [Acinetobacter pittii]KQE24628.1 hypothetical protein APD38_02445 [Acinetobacter pittii]